MKRFTRLTTVLCLLVCFSNHLVGAAEPQSRRFKSVTRTRTIQQTDVNSKNAEQKRKTALEEESKKRDLDRAKQQSSNNRQLQRQPQENQEQKKKLAEPQRGRGPSQTRLTQAELRELFLKKRNQQASSGDGGINPSGRPKNTTPNNNQNATRETNPSARNTRVSLENLNTKTKSKGGLKALSVNALPVPAQATSSVRLSLQDESITVAPGSFLDLPVAIQRNGQSGNLYVVCMQNQLVSASQLNLIRAHVRPLPDADAGLPFANNQAIIRIVVDASTAPGTTRSLRVQGLTCGSNRQQIPAVNFTVTAGETPAGDTPSVDPAPETADSCTIAVANNVNSPMLEGSLSFQGQPIGAFYDGNGNGVIDVIGANSVDHTSYLYPAQMIQFDNGGLEPARTVRRGRSYHSGSNIVVVCKLSTFSSVYRPQFVALYLQSNGTNVSVVKMVAGDELATAPLPAGATSDGIVMNTIENPSVTLDHAVLPIPTRMGSIKGTATGNVFYVTPSGNTVGCTIQFTFDTTLGLDG